MIVPGPLRTDYTCLGLLIVCRARELMSQSSLHIVAVIAISQFLSRHGRKQAINYEWRRSHQVLIELEACIVYWFVLLHNQYPFLVPLYATQYTLFCGKYALMNLINNNDMNRVVD